MQYHIGKSLRGAKPIASPKQKDYGAFSTTKLSDLMKQPMLPRQDVVPGVIPSGVTVIGAMPKMGKSRMVSALGLAVATGGSFANRRVGRSGSVLYLNLEEEADLARTRLAEFDEKSARKSARLELAFSADGNPIEILESMRRWALEHKDAALVIIDVWAQFHRGGSFGRSYEEQYKAMSLVTEFSKNYDIPVIIVTHTTKIGGKTGDIRAISGTIAQSAAPSTIIVMNTRDGTTDLNIISRRMRGARFTYQAGNETGTWTELKDTTSASAAAASPDRSAQVLALFVGEAELTSKDIAGSAFGGNANAANAQLSRMVASGKLRRVGKGKFALPA